MLPEMHRIARRTSGITAAGERRGLAEFVALP
jgi:hypothetical protein